MIGKTVGKYRILERLGRGGMGIVYKALDETLDREVAIKVLNPDLSDAELLKRFRAEAISLARLNHPFIATIYELHRHEDDLLMVMEFVRGETLQTLSERLGPLDPPQAAHVCVQVLDALSHAHRAGIVHRDLKPANVMLSDTGVVKVMDFGIARMMGGEHFTHAGYMMGTPAYMAPEQVLGQEIDGRADIYSVGVLFYRLLSRQLPFQADTAISMAQKQVAEAPTPLGSHMPDLPPWCESIISKALAKAPGDRFQTAEAFRVAIKTAVTPVALGELPTLATPTPTSAGLLRPPDVTVPQTNPSLTAAPATSPTAYTGDSNAPTMAAAIDPGPQTSGAHASGAHTPGRAATAPVERTGTTVVLGRTHMIGLVAVLVVLIAGIAGLGYAAFKRAERNSETAVLTPTDPAAPTDSATGQPAQPGTTPATPETATPVDPQKPVTDPAATGTTPPVPPTGTPAGTAAAPAPGAPGATTPPARTDGAARRGRNAPAATPVAPPVTPAAPPPPPPVTVAPEEPPPTPAAPELPPLMFKDVKILVAQGDNMRDRDAVLRLTGDHLTVLDSAGKAEILSLPYSSIVQAFYSRSKQPRWKGPDGKEAVASVDLGKLSFFRGDRNWLILTTQTNPVFIRLEDSGMRTILPAVQERTGLKIQR